MTRDETRNLCLGIIFAIIIVIALSCMFNNSENKHRVPPGTGANDTPCVPLDQLPAGTGPTRYRDRITGSFGQEWQIDPPVPGIGRQGIITDGWCNNVMNFDNLFDATKFNTERSGPIYYVALPRPGVS